MAVEEAAAAAEVASKFQRGEMMEIITSTMSLIVRKGQRHYCEEKPACMEHASIPTKVTYSVEEILREYPPQWLDSFPHLCYMNSDSMIKK